LKLVAPIIIAGLLLVTVLAAVEIRNNRRAAGAPPPPPAAAPPRKAPVIAPLDRFSLVALANNAADAYVAGRPQDPLPDPLVGRPFSVRLVFGCPDMSAPSSLSPGRAEFDPLLRTLRLTARPIDLSALPQVQEGALPGAVESVEAFWIPRPWLRSGGCPATHDYPPPATATPIASQTIGLARIFGPGDARTDRHLERPYEVVRRLDAATPAPSGPYYLRLEGTISSFADRRSIRCRAESPDHRPICLVAVTLSRVAFEGQNDEVLGEWRH
jgi:hypothetical protein